MEDVAAKGADVVEGEIEGPENKKHADCEEVVGEFFEGAPLYDWSRFPGWKSWFNEGEGYETHG